MRCTQDTRLHTNWTECHARPASGAHALMSAVQADSVSRPATIRHQRSGNIITDYVVRRHRGQAKLKH